MDRAGRNFLALTAVICLFVAYGLCALIGYGVLPLVEGQGQGDAAALFAVAGLTGLLAISASLAARTLWRGATAERRLSRRIDADAVSIPPSLHLATQKAGMGGRVTLIDSEAACSFVYGALAPRVVLSTGLLARLSAEELQAALEHEHYHVLSLDPLRDTIARMAVDALFFLPALRTIQRRYEAARELAADRRAASLVGRRPLAAALLKAMEGAEGDQTATIALAAPTVMDSRLTQLETGKEPNPRRIDTLNLGATILGALAFLALLVAVPLTIGGVSDLAHELEPASLLEGTAICLLPLAATAALTYRRLSAGTASPP